MLNIIKAEIIGVRSYSFNGKDGSPVYMTQMYCTFEDKRTEGMAACSCSVSERKAQADGIIIGGLVNLAFANKKWEYVGVC